MYCFPVTIGQDGWTRQAFNMGYHIQFGAYWEGYIRKTGNLNVEMMHVVCEDKEPFCVNTFKANSTFLDLGKQKFREGIDRVAYCIENDCFDQGYEFLDDVGYDQLTLPGWALKQLS